MVRTGWVFWSVVGVIHVWPPSVEVWNDQFTGGTFCVSFGFSTKSVAVKLVKPGEPVRSHTRFCDAPTAVGTATMPRSPLYDDRSASAVSGPTIRLVGRPFAWKAATRSFVWFTQSGYLYLFTPFGTFGSFRLA